MAWTAEDVARQFAEAGVDPSTQYDSADPYANTQERMERIASELNAGTRTSQDLQNSLGHLSRAQSSRSTGTSGGVTAGTVVDPGVTTTIPGAIDTEKTDAEKRREMDLVYSWLPKGALDLYIEEYIESGNADAAWAQIRKSKNYEQWFPGNLTEDGRVRLSEADYAQNIAAYDEVFINVGLNPAVFRERYGELIRGDVSSYELESERINPMYDRIVSQSQQLRSWYSENFGIELTDSALLGAAIDPDLGFKILGKQIDMAEIGGEALESGFKVSESLARLMTESSAGLDRAGAEDLFQTAATYVPMLNVLARRHSDPDDDFDIEEFVQADFFKDPTQQRRMRKLLAQERSTFAGGMFGTGAAVDRTTGGLAGLVER